MPTVGCERKGARLTKQGVRDLGNNLRKRTMAESRGCRHLWEEFTGWDCDEDRPVRRLRCGFCQEVRS